MNHKKVLQWYKKRSGLQGRYRVLEIIEGAGPGVVRGRTIYRETDDFAHLHSSRYQYAPYLFEALVQLTVFHLAATDPSERRTLIPAEIGNMEFARTCRAGEQIILEARLRVRDDEGVVWDARGLDDQGRAVMQIQGVRLHWVAE